MISKQNHVPTVREQAFLDSVEDTKYQREIINGLAPFIDKRAPEVSSKLMFARGAAE